MIDFHTNGFEGEGAGDEVAVVDGGNESAFGEFVNNDIEAFGKREFEPLILVILVASNPSAV